MHGDEVEGGENGSGDDLGRVFAAGDFDGDGLENLAVDAPTDFSLSATCVAQNLDPATGAVYISSAGAGPSGCSSATVTTTASMAARSPWGGSTPTSTAIWPSARRPPP